MCEPATQPGSVSMHAYTCRAGGVARRECTQAPREALWCSQTVGLQADAVVVSPPGPKHTGP